MKSIEKEIQLDASPQNAFHAFVHQLNDWWPREYSWSQDTLEHIGIQAEENGLCTEVGPYGFRADWGRVVSIHAPEHIVFTWQISPQRVPEPNPEKASLIKVVFHKEGVGKTKITFKHSNFENHGEGAEGYRQAMDSEMGWDYILNCFASYVLNKYC